MESVQLHQPFRHAFYFIPGCDQHVAGLLPARILVSQQKRHAMRRFRRISRQGVDDWDLLVSLFYQSFSFIFYFRVLDFVFSYAFRDRSLKIQAGPR